MKNFKRTIAFVATLALVFAAAPTQIAQAAVSPESARGVDNYSVTSGIDSLTQTSYSCKAGNNSAQGSAQNVVKIHLKEHNNTASTGKEVKAFTAFTDDPSWVRIVAVDDGRDCNIPHVIDDNNFPSSRYVSGTEVTVSNHIAEEDYLGNQTYEGGAWIFIVLNDYRGGENGEVDRRVGVSIVSRTSKGTMTYEDLTAITIDVDAAEKVVEVVAPDPEPVTNVPEPEQAPVANTEPAAGSNNNTSNGNNNEIGFSGDNNTVIINNGTIIINPGQTQKPEATATPEATAKPEATATLEATQTPEATEEPKKVESTEPEEEQDELDESDDTTVFDTGDEIETKSAVFTVTSSEDGKYEVEYSDFDDEDATKVIIPKAIKKDGISFAVTSIADGAFKGNKDVEEITVGSNVEEIGAKAFWGCKNLKVLKFASKKLKLRNIGSQAFKKLSGDIIIKVPRSKINAYKSMFRKKGLNKKARFKAI